METQYWGFSFGACFICLEELQSLAFTTNDHNHSFFSVAQSQRLSVSNVRH